MVVPCLPLCTSGARTFLSFRSIEKTLSPRPQKGIYPAHVMSGFWPLKLSVNKFLLCLNYLVMVTCYASLGKWIQRLTRIHWVRQEGTSDSVTKNHLHRGMEEWENTADSKESSVDQEGSLGGGEGQFCVRVCMFVCMCYVVLWLCECIPLHVNPGFYSAFMISGSVCSCMIGVWLDLYVWLVCQGMNVDGLQVCVLNLKQS